MGTEEPMDMDLKAKVDVKTEQKVKIEDKPEKDVKDGEELKKEDTNSVVSENVKVEVDSKQDVQSDDKPKSESDDKPKSESDDKPKSESDSQEKEELSVKQEDSPKQDETVSPLEKKVIRQIEYYFGDYNLFADKFLREEIKTKDGGWIEMETMMKFNRLKQLTSDSVFVIGALKKSTTKLMEINEDGTKIRRTPLKPVPLTYEDQRKEIDNRTVYVKGFSPQTGLDELLDYFQPHGNPENILMRRRNNKKFKGSVFATFASKEDADAFLKLKDLKFKSTELLREMKLDYVRRKDEWFQQMIKEREEKRNKKKEVKDEGEKDEKDLEESKKGCLLKIVGLGEGTMWEDIKEILSPHGTVAFVDYSKGKPTAIVRFETGVAAEVLKAVATEADDKMTIKIKDADTVASVLDDEEEVEYWKTVKQSKFQRSAGRGRRGGKFGGRGGFRGKRKHGNFKGDGGPFKKVKANGAGD